MDQLLHANINDLSPVSTKIAVATLLFAGALYCFVGYRLFRLLLGLTGFLLAGSVAAGLAGWLSGGRFVFMAIALGIGGIMGAIALNFMYRAGVFCIGMCAATLVAHQVLAARPEAWAPWAALGIGVLGGMAALGIERTAMIMAMSAIGAWMLVQGTIFIALTFGMQPCLENPEHETWVFMAIVSVWGLLTVMGTTTQFRGLRPRQEQDGRRG